MKDKEMEKRDELISNVINQKVWRMYPFNSSSLHLNPIWCFTFLTLSVGQNGFFLGSAMSTCVSLTHTQHPVWVFTLTHTYTNLMAPHLDRWQAVQMERSHLLESSKNDLIHSTIRVFPSGQKKYSKHISKYLHPEPSWLVDSSVSWWKEYVSFLHVRICCFSLSFVINEWKKHSEDVYREINQQKEIIICWALTYSQTIMNKTQE